MARGQTDTPSTKRSKHHTGMLLLNGGGHAFAGCLRSVHPLKCWLVLPLAPSLLNLRFLLLRQVVYEEEAAKFHIIWEQRMKEYSASLVKVRQDCCSCTSLIAHRHNRSFVGVRYACHVFKALRAGLGSSSAAPVLATDIGTW